MYADLTEPRSLKGFKTPPHSFQLFYICMHICIYKRDLNSYIVLVEQVAKSFPTFHTRLSLTAHSLHTHIVGNVGSRFSSHCQSAHLDAGLPLFAHQYIWESPEPRIPI